MKSLQKFMLIVVIAAGCSKDDIPKETPSCIQDKIKEIKAESVSNPPTKIFSYSYKGKTVYYIPPKCCDFPSVLLDENCNVICSPDGGLTGAGDGKCPGISKELSDEKLIWEDDRRP